MLVAHHRQTIESGECMHVSKWLYLACSTAAVVAWALYKAYRFYRSPEGQALMQQRNQKPAAPTQGASENDDKGV